MHVLQFQTYFRTATWSSSSLGGLYKAASCSLSEGRLYFPSSSCKSCRRKMYCLIAPCSARFATRFVLGNGSLVSGDRGILPAGVLSIHSWIATRSSAHHHRVFSVNTHGMQASGRHRMGTRVTASHAVQISHALHVRLRLEVRLGNDREGAQVWPSVQMTGSSMRFWVMAHSKSSGRSSGRLLGRGGMPHTRSTCGADTSAGSLPPAGVQPSSCAGTAR
mmetsp:Transcript_12274/g.36887  ORF Transcript_12274/g.36887 Transcript_12274/m.36887 type:complete len:220 (-) Transcript_12274:3327-3986(-)